MNVDDSIHEIRKSSDGLEVIAFMLVLMLGAVSYAAAENFGLSATFTIGVGVFSPVILAAVLRWHYQRKKPIAILESSGLRLRGEKHIPWSSLVRIANTQGVVKICDKLDSKFSLEISEAQLGYEGFREALRFLHHNSPIHVEDFF